MNKAGIRGWLLLPAFGLILVPVDFFRKNIFPVMENHGFSGLRLSYPILWGDVLILLMAAVVAYYFFTRKKPAPVLFILELLIVTVMWHVMDALFDTPRDPPIDATLISSMVFIPYFALSKRVKATFTREMTDGSLPDRLMKSLAPGLERLYRLVCRAGKLIVLWVFLFLVAVTLLHCTLRSLRIDGDILHTLDYL